MKFNLVEKVIRPRRTPGVDWGSLRFVLARRGHKELWWQYSCKSWEDRLMGYQRSPANLILVEDARMGYPNHKTIHE